VSETLTSVGNPYVFYFLSQSQRFAIHNTEPLASQHNPAVTVINTVVPTADYPAVDPTASPVIAFVETVARLAGRWVWSAWNAIHCLISWLRTSESLTWKIYMYSIA